MFILAALVMVQSVDEDAQRWAIERGFEAYGEQEVTKAKNRADEFVLSIRKRPELTSTWPSVANGALSVEVCAQAYEEPIAAIEFLEQVAKRMRLSDEDSAKLSNDCEVYNEGLQAGRR